jgi:SAM-dependent methyltransferase
MDRNYWEKIAPGYNEEIFDVLHNDKKNVIRSSIRKVASSKSTVIDAGCAIGKWLPLLAPAFGKVIAADISAKNLSIAKQRNEQFENIEYVRVDMSSKKARIPKADVALCVNAILTDSIKKRNVFFHHLSLCVRKGGHLLLVIPSLESWMLTSIIQKKWAIDKGLFSEHISPKAGLEKYQKMREGNMDIDNVPTKHYLREELSLLLSREKFDVLSTRKIEYSWKTEFVHPPSWLKDPTPWDWFVLAKKR